jgi:hypothetical protein
VLQQLITHDWVDHDYIDQHTKGFEALAPVVAKYPQPERLHVDGLSETRRGGLGLPCDLHDLYLLASHLDMAWMLVGQAAKGARDHELIRAVDACAEETEAQQDWLTTRLKAAAPQALLVAD